MRAVRFRLCEAFTGQPPSVQGAEQTVGAVPSASCRAVSRRPAASAGDLLRRVRAGEQ